MSIFNNDVGARSGSEAQKVNADCEAPWERGVSTPLRRVFVFVINRTHNLKQHSHPAKYFAFRQGARLRGVASGYISVLATKHQRKRQSGIKKKADVDKL